MLPSHLCFEGNLIPKREAEDEHAADDLPGGHRFAEDGDRDDDGDERVDVAEDRRFLTGELLERGEIHAISHTRVKNSDDKEARPADAVERCECESARQEDVWEQYHDRREELKEGAVDTLDVLYKFIKQDDRRVEGRRAETEKDADKVASAADVADARDHYESDSRHKKAEYLLRGEPLLKEYGADYRDDDRREIIAEGCDRDRRIFVRLEKEYPVDTHRHTRK